MTAVEIPPEDSDPSSDPRGEITDGAFSTNVRWRDPTGEEREWALSIAHRLETPDAPSDRVRRLYPTPPGRLVALQAVQGQAHRAMGMVDASRPWVRVLRPRRGPEPTRLGVLTDMSGSQHECIEVSTSLTWVLHTAGRDAGVEVSSLLFGDDVVTLCHPGTAMPGVPEPVTLSQTELFDRACQSLHALLDLDDRGAYRVVVVFSDGGFTPEEIEHRGRWLDRWARSGVRILWVSDDRQILDTLPEPVDSLRLYSARRAKVDVITTVMRLLGKDPSG